MLLCGLGHRLGDQGIQLNTCINKRFVPTCKSSNQVWSPLGSVKRVKQMGPEADHLTPSRWDMADHLTPSSTHVNVCNLSPTLCLPGAHWDIFYHYTICSHEQREFLEISLSVFIWYRCHHYNYVIGHLELHA
jgi:hypothetical protein